MTNEEHIEQLKKLRSFHNGSYGRSINKAIEALNQQKEGEWIVWDTSSYDWTYKCSECGSIKKETSKYCPNCGVHMRGEEE